MALFTQEQLKELEVFFGLKPVIDTLPVRDGYVHKTELIWWRGGDGPQHNLAGGQWANIKQFPNLYQHTKPNISPVIYED